MTIWTQLRHQPRATDSCWKPVQPPPQAGLRDGCASVLWVPSHIGFFPERLQAQNQTFSEIAGLNSMGEKAVTLYEPSQNGCDLERPQAHHQ